MRSEAEQTRRDDERRIMAQSVNEPGFQLLMAKIQEAADSYPLEMAKMRLKGEHDKADALLAVWNGFKYIMPQKLEIIVNGDYPANKSFSFRRWLQQIFGG